MAWSFGRPLHLRGDPLRKTSNSAQRGSLEIQCETPSRMLAPKLSSLPVVRRAVRSMISAVSSNRLPMEVIAHAHRAGWGPQVLMCRITRLCRHNSMLLGDRAMEIARRRHMVSWCNGFSCRRDTVTPFATSTTFSTAICQADACRRHQQSVERRDCHDLIPCRCLCIIVSPTIL